MAILVGDVVTITTRHEDPRVVPASVDACAEGDEIGSFRVDLSAGRRIGTMRNIGRESWCAGGRKSKRTKKECNGREMQIHVTDHRLSPLRI